jgi:hypothetical protein
MRYIEGDFDYDARDNPLLKNVLYGGDIQSGEYYAGSTVTGKLNGMMVKFEFSQFSGANDTDTVREWLQISGSNAWQANVEFVKNATEIREERRLSTVIYMVLDSSMSMGKENIDLIKESVGAALEPFGIKRGSPPPERPRTPVARVPSGNLPNYLFVDFAPLLAGLLENGYGIGLGYERAFTDMISIAFYFDVISASNESGSSSLFGWDILIRPRLYPSTSAVGGWYVGAMIGYGMLIKEEEYYGYGYDYNYDSDLDSVFTIGLETGYKFVFGHFGLEPWIGYAFGDAGGFKIGATLAACCTCGFLRHQ